MSQDDFYKSKDPSYFGAIKLSVFNRVDRKDFGCILDIGGGDGASSKYVLENGWSSKAYILDPFSELESTTDIEVSRESADDLSVYRDYRENGIQFDSVFCFDVLEHLFNPWAVLESVSECQAPGGRLLVSMPNARFVAMTVPLVLFGRFDYKKSGIMDRTHIRWFTRATTIELIEGAGYEIEDISAIIEPRVKLLNTVTFGFFRRFFEYQYIVQASKK